jgi:hypothetical protein
MITTTKIGGKKTIKHHHNMRMSEIVRIKVRLKLKDYLMDNFNV